MGTKGNRLIKKSTVNAIICKRNIQNTFIQTYNTAHLVIYYKYEHVVYYWSVDTEVEGLS